MPDIDLDFDERRRGEMIRYATERYGADRVAQIITYSTIKAKAAIKDAARVLGHPYSFGDRLTKMMPPPVMGKEYPLEEARRLSAELDDAWSNEPEAGSKPRPIGPPWPPLRPTSATNAANALPPRVVQHGSRARPTARRCGWGSTSGRSAVTGRSAGKPPDPTRPAGAWPTAFAHATSIS
jgi:hypothetical protein